MCPAIAAFANASTDSAVHWVDLTNDWGCDFHKPDNNDEYEMACKTCTHGDYAPAKQLCSYLMEHTSTEFPSVNFKRALACLNTQYHVSAWSHPSVERLSNRPIWSDHATMVRAPVVVGVEYLTDLKDSPEILRISAKRRQP